MLSIRPDQRTLREQADQQTSSEKGYTPEDRHKLKPIERAVSDSFNTSGYEWIFLSYTNNTLDIVSI